jgi:hypothetical protein
MSYITILEVDHDAELDALDHLRLDLDLEAVLACGFSLYFRPNITILNGY